MWFFRLRPWIATLFALLGLLLHVQLGWQAAWYLYVTALILVLTHFLFGTVVQAFQALRKGKPQQARMLLTQIRRPEWLLKGHRAYYYFVSGMLALNDKQVHYGKQDLQKSLQLGLRSVQDKALATLNLAHACFTEGLYPEARQHLQTARGFEINDLVLKKHLDELEEALRRNNA
jgi:hypothetical protein